MMDDHLVMQIKAAQSGNHSAPAFSSRLATRLLLLIAVFALGCVPLAGNAAQDGPAEVEAGFMKPASGFVDGTRVLAILAEKFARDRILQEGWVARNWYPRLLEAGYRDADIADGSEISAMSYCYGHNARVGCKHQGLFFAHVPQELRDRLVAGEAGNVSVLNDILEIELRMLPSKQLFGVVKRIYRPAGAWGDCRVKLLATSAAYALSPYGPPVGLWLVCDGLQREGWFGMHVRGAPLPSGTDEGEAANMHEWRNIPSPQDLQIQRPE